MTSKVDFTLRVVMTVSTVVLFAYGLFKSYDTLEIKRKKKKKINYI